MQSSILDSLFALLSPAFLFTFFLRRFVDCPLAALELENYLPCNRLEKLSPPPSRVLRREKREGETFFPSPLSRKKRRGTHVNFLMFPRPVGGQETTSSGGTKYLGRPEIELADEGEKGWKG